MKGLLAAVAVAGGLALLPLAVHAQESGERARLAPADTPQAAIHRELAPVDTDSGMEQHGGSSRTWARFREWLQSPSGFAALVMSGGALALLVLISLAKAGVYLIGLATDRWHARNQPRSTHRTRAAAVPTARLRSGMRPLSYGPARLNPGAEYPSGGSAAAGGGAFGVMGEFRSRYENPASLGGGTGSGHSMGENIGGPSMISMQSIPGNQGSVVLMTNGDVIILDAVGRKVQAELYGSSQMTAFNYHVSSVTRYLAVVFTLRFVRRGVSRAPWPGGKRIEDAADLVGGHVVDQMTTPLSVPPIGTRELLFMRQTENGRYERLRVVVTPDDTLVVPEGWVPLN